MSQAGPSSSRRESRSIKSGDIDEESQLRQGRGASASTRRVTKVDEEDGDEDNDGFGELAQPLVMPQIDAEFLNQPMKKDEAVLKLNNLIKEWKDVERKVQGYLELLANSAGELQETLVDTEGDDQNALEELDLADRDYRRMLDKMYEIRLRKESLERLRSTLGDGRSHPDAFGQMEELIRRQLAQYMSQTSRQKYLKSEPYSNFRMLLWESRGTGQGIPNIKTFISREEGDPESDDEDVELQAVAQNYKDPISFTWLEKPVRSHACKHVYSRESITSLIRQSYNGTSAPCPVAGCNKTIVLSELQDDPQLERRVQQQRRREAEQQERAGDGYQALDDDEEESDEEDSNVRDRKSVV